MDELEIEYLSKISKLTKIGKEYLSKTHKNYLPNDEFYKDLYSEEKIEEEECLYKEPRIGDEYQVIFLDE